MRFSKALVAISLHSWRFRRSLRRADDDAGPFVAGEILVKFSRAPTPTRELPPTERRVDTARRNSAHGRPSRSRPAGDETAAIARYLRNPNVLYAEPNYIRSMPMPIAHGRRRSGTRRLLFRRAVGARQHRAGVLLHPLDRRRALLLQRHGDADIDAPEAWAISTGNSGVTVAVIDSGIDYTHPDLAANYAGGDDFVSADGDPMDDHGHGTHVAGTIAAAMDNPTGSPAEAEGVVGVAPNARILAYKVCRADGSCDDFAIQQAIARAITDGAKVINMSLGQTAYSQSLDDAVQDAWNAGLVIVAGAGNDGTTEPFYPAAFDNVISVAAFDEDHRRASFSNYGSWVDISAPGNVIMSTYPMSACGSSTTPGDTGCYAWNSGTSMATPHVAGAAALVWSRSDVTSNSQVVDILLNSADGQGVSTVRLDSWTIHGGLNLHDAVSYGLDESAAARQCGTRSDRAGQRPRRQRDGDASTAAHPPTATAASSAYEWREGGTPIATGATAAVCAGRWHAHVDARGDRRRRRQRNRQRGRHRHTRQSGQP